MVEEKQENKETKKNEQTKEKTTEKQKDNSKGLLILLLNLLIFPGLGSLIGGKKKEGIIQIILAIISIPLMFVLIGFISYLAVWIWGIVTGVKALNE